MLRVGMLYHGMNEISVMSKQWCPTLVYDKWQSMSTRHLDIASTQQTYTCMCLAKMTLLRVWWPNRNALHRQLSQAGGVLDLGSIESEAVKWSRNSYREIEEWYQWQQIKVQEVLCSNKRLPLKENAYLHGKSNETCDAILLVWRLLYVAMYCTHIHRFSFYQKYNDEIYLNEDEHQRDDTHSKDLDTEMYGSQNIYLLVRWSTVSQGGWPKS